MDTDPARGRDFDLPRHSHYSGVIPMVFEHSAAGVRAENLINIFIVYRIVLQPVWSRLCVCLCLDDVSCVPHMDTVIVSTIGREDTISDMCAPAAARVGCTSRTRSSTHTGPCGAPRSGTRPALFDISAPAPYVRSRLSRTDTPCTPSTVHATIR